MLNALTIDVEEWFCPHFLRHSIPFKSWDHQEMRVSQNVHQILRLLKQYNVEATFFVLGWVAERVPELIKEIEAEGHEIASHGYSHGLLTEMSQDDFKKDIEKFFDIVQPLVEQKICGYRAPAFSITKNTLWALNILKDFGLEYDSSVYPMGIHPDYGIASAALTPYYHENSLLEIPLSCATIGSKRIPCSGGAYFRLYPYPLFKKLFKKCNADGRAGIFYLHPWEIDSKSPQIALPVHKKFRLYQNIDKTSGRLEQLMEDFQFTSLRNLIKDCKINQTVFI